VKVLPSVQCLALRVMLNKIPTKEQLKCMGCRLKNDMCYVWGE